MTMTDEQPGKSPGLWAIISSVLAAAFGVQSSKNRERDFVHGKTVHFVVAGIIFTILFIASLVMIVKTVLSNAGM